MNEELKRILQPDILAEQYSRSSWEQAADILNRPESVRTQSANPMQDLSFFSDLRDRYSGRIVEMDRIELRDWVAAPSVVAVNMDADSFRYARNEDTSLVPHEVHLYFGELVITDYIDP